MTRRRKPRNPVGGGGARHPNSLANLRNGNPAATNQAIAARSHGAYAAIAREALDGKTREIFEALAEDAPVRGPDGGLPSHDALPVRLLAETLIRLESVSEYL